MYSKIFGDNSVLVLDYWFGANSPATISIAMKNPDVKENNGRYERGQKVFDYDNQKMMRLNADECDKFERLLSSFLTKQTVNYNDPVAERRWSKDGVSGVSKLFVTSHKNMPTILISTQGQAVEGEEKHFIIINSRGDLLTIINFIKSTFSILPAMACYHYWSTNWASKNKKDSSGKNETNYNGGSDSNGPSVPDTEPSFPTIPDSPAATETESNASQFDGIGVDGGSDLIVF